MKDNWRLAIDTIEDCRGYDLPLSLKDEIVRVCDHLYRQNPRKGQFDAAWSLSKVVTYLETALAKFEAMRAELDTTGRLS